MGTISKRSRLVKRATSPRNSIYRSSSLSTQQVLITDFSDTEDISLLRNNIFLVICLETAVEPGDIG
jgi:hypothetical protein